MPAPKLIEAQRDFSGGQINAAAKRRDDSPLVKAGGRTMTNWRIMASGQAVPRPGRRAKFRTAGPRNETFRIAQLDLNIAFTTGRVTITDADGTPVTENATGDYLWTDATVALISWTIAGNNAVICYPGMQPQVIEYVPASNSWSFGPYEFATVNGQVQAPFYRLSAAGATITPSATTGPITLVCSVDYFTQAMADHGKILSILGQQVQITGYTDPQTAAANVLTTQLPDGVEWEVASVAIFQLHQVVQEVNGLRKAEIGEITPGTPNIVAGMMMDSVTIYGTAGAISDTLASPLGKTGASNFAAHPAALPTIQWLEQFMGELEGWPTACFFSNDRLGFTGFPQKPNAILWSAIGSYSTCWVDASATQTNPTAGATASSAILEFIPGSPRVSNVVGWSGDDFVFTDRGIYQIPISAQSPLKPGSVEFRRFSEDGCAPIKPVPTLDTILYVNAGLSRVSVVRATGTLTRPYVSDDVSDFHSDLFTARPIGLAIATGDGEKPERYVYVWTADGSVIVGKFLADKSLVGWQPWTCSGGQVKWVSAAGQSVFYTTTYRGTTIAEVEDSAFWLDGFTPINNVPAALTLGGKGPVWWHANGTVSVMDGLLDLGDRQVDSNGFIIPAQPGEDLSALTVVAGVFSPQAFEPFVPDAGSGQDAGQRMKRRRAPRMAVTVANSTGSFAFCGIEIPPYNFSDNGDIAPPVREETYRARTLGRSFDPRIPIVKTRPGPLTLVEVGMEATV